MTLDAWLDSFSQWYQARKHDQVQELQLIIQSAPAAVWGPELTDEQSKAIACWLDGCLRLFEHAKHQDPDTAYQWLQTISAKLEQCATNSVTDIDIKDWCLKRLQHITVLALEFCNQQQDQSIWKGKAVEIVDYHIRLMDHLSWNELSDQKHDQGKLH